MQGLINRFRSDEALMQAYGRGDSAAFECLYQRHKDGLFAFIYRSCRRSAVVEELAQETWEAVVKAAPLYRPQARFRTWLYQIAHHRQVDFWRRKDNHHLTLESAQEPHSSDNPAQAQQLGDDVMRAVSALPGEQRDALLLQEQGFSLRDIAEITGAVEETVKSRLRYARKQLREELVAYE